VTEKLMSNFDVTLFTDSTLFYCVGGKKREVVTSRQQIMEILHANHSHAMGGHSGINATQKKISQGFWWHRMKKDVHEYVSALLLFLY
jgi:hypothetical protein